MWSSATQSNGHRLLGFRGLASVAWLPWPGFQGHREARARLIMGLPGREYLDGSRWSTFAFSQHDPEEYWDSTMALADASDFEAALEVMAESPMPKEVHAACAAILRKELEELQIASSAELVPLLERAGPEKTTPRRDPLAGNPATGERWLRAPERRDSAVRTLLIPGLIGFGAGLIAIWPRKRRGSGAATATAHTRARTRSHT